VFAVLSITMILIAKAYEKIHAYSTFCSGSKFLTKVNHYLQKNFLFSFPIRLMLEAYLELCVSAFVNFKNLANHTAGDIFASAFSVFLVIAAVLLPPFLAAICTIHQYSIRDPYFKARFGSLFEGLDTSRSLAVMYYPAFTLRRLLYSWTAVYLVENAMYQVQVFTICSILYSVYLVSVRPFSSNVANIMEVINETCVNLFAFGLFLLTPMVSDADARYEIGWGLISLTMFAMVSNMTVIVFVSLKQLIRSFRYCRLKSTQK